MAERTSREIGNGRGIRPLQKVSTGITGLDDILRGGFPAGRMSLVKGLPGTGKTVLGTEFIFRGALAEEPGLIISFEESTKALKENAAGLGWDLGALEREGKIFLLEGIVDPETVISGDFSMKSFLAVISGKGREIGAKRLMIDALDVLFRLFDDPVKVRAELFALSVCLRETGMTSLLTLKPGPGEVRFSFEHYFDSIVDCIVYLDMRVREQVATRRLRVLKYRGSGFGHNEYPFVISESGFRVVPISSVGLRHKPLGEKISTGLERLDRILEGGVARGSCVLFAGEPGTGKTLFAGTFTRAACQRKERVLYMSFEESKAAVLSNLHHAGVDLEPFLEAGLLDVVAVMPESMGAEEHLMYKLDRLESFQPSHVVIDAVSACERMGGKQAAFEFLTRTVNATKERGITTLLTNQTETPGTCMGISGNGISSMIDTVVILSYVSGYGETNRTLEVIKSRGSAHSNQVREFVITGDGIQILDVYVGEGQVLTGVARSIREAQEALEARRKEAEIRTLERRITALKAQMQTQSEKHEAEIEAAQLQLENLRVELARILSGRDQRRRMRGDDNNRWLSSGPPLRRPTGG